MTWIAVHKSHGMKLATKDPRKTPVYYEDEHGWLIYELPHPPRRPQPHKKKTRNGKKHRKRYS